MQPSVPRGFQSSGTSGILDFGRYSGAGLGTTAAAAAPTRPIGFQESVAADDDDWKGGGTAFSTGPQSVGGFGSYIAGQQAGYNGGFPSSKPPQFPPPQPPASVASGSTTASKCETKAAPSSHRVAGRMASSTSSGSISQLPQDSLRGILAQVPSPPSQGGASSSLSPAQSSLAQGSQSSQGAASEEDRKKEEMLYLTTPEAERASREKYGLLGILKVIRMTDPDLNTLALGMDLTTLGLNLNSPECLYATFASPWSDTPAGKDPEFHLPQCYYMNPPQLKTAHLARFSLETLFYIFFNMPRDTLQAYAAAELYNRGWRYHQEELKTWFLLQKEDGQTSRWICFDPVTWEKRYYTKPVDTSGFLTEDDVRVKVPPSGGMPTSPSG